MSIISLVKKVFPPRIQSWLKIVLSYFRLFKARMFGHNYDCLNKNLNKKPRILFYCLNGLFYAGTQKHMQILSKYLNKDLYDVYFMYSSKSSNARYDYLANSGVKMIDFSFDKVEKKSPYSVLGMKPHIFDVVKDNKIDLLVVAGSGYPEFPVANITKLPIISLNIFGSVSVQDNIKKHLCISELLANILKKSLPSKKIDVIYVPSEDSDADSMDRGMKLRQSLRLKDGDFVFGRIGRPDDTIFDPIGIRAFQKIVKDYPSAHYLIMAPPPILKKIVKDDNIPNVHFLQPSSSNKDVWAFHQALDAMAHFRHDGETCGLNMAESMLCSKPVISHKSTIWNAHLEYLDSSFSRVAEIDDIEQYAKYMTEFIALKQNGEFDKLKQAAFSQADKFFSIKTAINKFEKNLNETLKEFYNN